MKKAVEDGGFSSIGDPGLAKPGGLEIAKRQRTQYRESEFGVGRAKTQAVPGSDSVEQANGLLGHEKFHVLSVEV